MKSKKSNKVAKLDSCFGVARHFGAGVNKLTLPASGHRNNGHGALDYRGNNGYYWSSTELGIYANYLYFLSSYAVTNYNNRPFGFSVRCVSE